MWENNNNNKITFAAPTNKSITGTTHLRSYTYSIYLARCRSCSASCSSCSHKYTWRILCSSNAYLDRSSHVSFHKIHVSDIWYVWNTIEDSRCGPICISQTIHGTGWFTYIDPQNFLEHLIVGKWQMFHTWIVWVWMISLNPCPLSSLFRTPRTESFDRPGIVIPFKAGFDILRAVNFQGLGCQQGTHGISYTMKWTNNPL